MLQPEKYFQDLVLALQAFWAQRGCMIGQPTDLEVGAGTFSKHTFLRSLGPEPWSTAYVEPCRRPTDGRYGENPNRLQYYYQFQVLMKPAPVDVQATYLEMMEAIGIDPELHDIRFVEDDWESPTLGAWGLGWEVWLNGMEMTQFTYFQQVGGFDLNPVSVELTLGIERIAMYLQGVDSVYDLLWSPGLTYGDVHHRDEVEYSKYNFETADVELQLELFSRFEAECRSCLEQSLVIPAYDYTLKCSHAFNMLDARGAISVTERQGYIARVRALARQVAVAWVNERERLGHPLIKDAVE